MTNQLELFKEVFVTLVTHDNTIVVGRIGLDVAEVQATEGPSHHRANDMLSGIAAALAHDEMFGELDSVRDAIVNFLPWQSDGASDVANIAIGVGLRPLQAGALLPVLDAMVDDGLIERTSDDTFYIRED